MVKETIKKNKKLIFVVFLTFICSLVYFFVCNNQVFGYSQEAGKANGYYPSGGNNYTFVRMNGPSGTGGLKIKIAFTGSANIRNKQQFVKSARWIGISTENSNNYYNARLVSSSSVQTTQDSDGLYKIISFTIRYTVPAHYYYKDVSTDKPTEIGARYFTTASFGHSGTSREVDVKYEINITNMGMITHSNNTRYYGTSSTVNLKRDNYTVSFNANGGPANPDSQTVACGSNITLPNPSRKANSKFAGWYTAANGGSFVGNAGASYNVCSGNRTLYAHWSNYSYTINYNANGGTGNVSAQTVDLGGGNITLRPGGFVYPEKTLIGWNTKADKTGTSYSLGQTISKTTLSSSVGAKVTLYAVWRANQYLIKFDSNGGSGSMPDQKVDRDATVNLNKCTGISKKGYTFAGWNTEQFTNDVKYKDQATVSKLTADDDYITLYAVWKKTGTGFVQRPLLDDRMFYNAREIEGQNGTTYDGNLTDSRMAHIDEEGNPGYFTYK